MAIHECTSLQVGELLSTVESGPHHSSGGIGRSSEIRQSRTLDVSSTAADLEFIIVAAIAADESNPNEDNFLIGEDESGSPCTHDRCHLLALHFQHVSLTPHANDTRRVPIDNQIPGIIKPKPPASPPSPPSQPDMAEKDWDEAYFVMPNPLECFTKLILLQADLIYNCFVTLFSPIFWLHSIVSESYRRAEETKDAVESAVRKVPSTIAHGIAVLIKKLIYGFLGAMYVCMVLTVLLVLAVVVGVGLVELWVEHPVSVREKLYFDYTEPHPKAVFCLGNVGFERFSRRKQLFMAVPRGHTFLVSLVLLMPESDFNRKIGVFQINYSNKINLNTTKIPNLTSTFQGTKSTKQNKTME
ncbi:hypothetical protein I3760_07G079500 [Carya illinoinensis]|nr:hypothetical protein I3760_07G079500 [Carya illinoinensis]